MSAVDKADIVCYVLIKKLEIPINAKPFARRGRKAAGLITELKMAELPKDESWGRSAFFIGNNAEAEKGFGLIIIKIRNRK